MTTSQISALEKELIPCHNNKSKYRTSSAAVGSVVPVTSTWVSKVATSPEAVAWVITRTRMVYLEVTGAVEAATSFWT